MHILSTENCPEKLISIPLSSAHLIGFCNIGKLFLELLQGAEFGGIQEVHEHEELRKIVLQRRSSQQHPV